MNVSVTGFYQMRSICRKTGSRVKIIKKYGLPFFFYRNKKRKAFFIGILAGFCLLMVLSQHIWNIHVEGNRHNSTQTILNYLDDIQIHHGILKKDVDCSYIAEQMRKEFPDITWVSAKISGTRLILEVKENATANKIIKQTEENPSSIIAGKSGTIVSMITRKGTPCKKVGESCEKDVYKRQVMICKISRGEILLITMRVRTYQGLSLIHIFMICVTTVYWFNPAVYFIKKRRSVI